MAEVGSSTGQCFLGRASPVDTATPFRPIAEVLVQAVGDGGRPDDPVLEPYLPAVERFVPHWRRPRDSVVHESPAILGESVLRVVSWLSGDEMTLVVLEDLHWADLGTIAVCDYVIDHLADTRIAVVACVRAGEYDHASRSVFDRGAVLTLRPLPPADVEVMVEACVGGSPDRDVLNHVSRVAGGLPLLVEDMLTGESRFDAMVRGRFAALRESTQAAVIVAAIVGEEFDLGILSDALGSPLSSVAQAIHEASALQLLAPRGRGFAFRHALTRDVILGDASVAISARTPAVAAALESTGRREMRVRAAELWIDAGDPGRGCGLLVAAADDAADRGAPETALELLKRAAAAAADPRHRTGIELRRLELLVVGGYADAAIELGSRLLDSEAITERATRLLARAFLGAGRIDEARALLHRVHGPEANVLQAWAVLAGDRSDRRRVAEQLARQTAVAAETHDQPAVACDALEIVALCARTRSLAEAEDAIWRALAIAEAEDLQLVRLRLLNELGTIDMLARADGARLQRARAAARAAGSLDTAIGIDVNIASLHAMRNELDEARSIADEARAGAERLGLHPLAAAAVLIHAVSDGFEGRSAELRAGLRVAEQLAPDDPDLHAFGWGAGQGLCALVREEFDEAVRCFERAVQPDPPVGSLDTAHGPLIAVLASKGLATEEHLAAARRVATPGAGWSDLWIGFGEAALRHDADAVAAAHGAARRYPLFRAVGLRLVAEAALRDGWGEPVVWLREAEATFVAGGQVRIAGACRALLQQAGVVTSRRRGADRDLDEALLKRGVTARESEVLELVAERLGNKEIAARLYLSPRTVEKHVASLRMKLDAPNRAALIDLARR